MSEYLSGQRSVLLSIFKNQPAIDHDMRDTGRKLIRFLVGSPVTDRIRIKHNNIGKFPGFRIPRSLMANTSAGLPVILCTACSRVSIFSCRTYWAKTRGNAPKTRGWVCPQQPVCADVHFRPLKKLNQMIFFAIEIQHAYAFSSSRSRSSTASYGSLPVSFPSWIKFFPMNCRFLRFGHW